MKPTRKIFSLFLALALIASFVPAAFAANADTDIAGKFTKITVAVNAADKQQLDITVAGKTAAGTDGSTIDGSAHKFYIGPKGLVGAAIQGDIDSGGSSTLAELVTSLTALTLTTVNSTDPVNTLCIGTNEAKEYVIYGSLSGTFTDDDYCVSNSVWVVVDPTDSTKFIFSTEPHSGIIKDAGAYNLAAPSVEVQGDSGAEKVTTAAPTAADFVINLSSETLTVPEAFKVAAYSLDGGTKWKKGAIGSKDGADISKLLNKGLTLWLTDAYDDKAKEPTKGVKEVKETVEGTETVTTVGVKAATVIKFAAIEARPALSEKLVANYSLGSDPSGKTNGRWQLSAKDATSVSASFTTVQALVPANGKKFDASKDVWGKFDPQGVPVKDMLNGKAVKTVYLYRTAPVVGSTNTPASKVMKVSATSVGKAPTLKPDYKKENIKVKADIMLYFGPRDPVAGWTALADTATANLITGLKAEAGKFAGPFKKEDKDPVDLSEYLTEEATYVTAWIGATAKKPATMQQEITLAPRAYLLNSVIANKKGKIDIGKTNEVLTDATANKWGKVPKADGAAYTGQIRVKNTAKAGKADKNTAKMGYDKLAASRPGAIEITYGEYEAPKKEGRDGKNGFLQASIIAPPYKGRIALVRPKLVYSSDTNNSPPAWGIPDPATLATLDFGFTPDDSNKNFAVQYEIITGDTYADVQTKLDKFAADDFIDTNDSDLATFGDVTASASGAQTLTVPLATVEGAGTVNLAPDEDKMITDSGNFFATGGALEGYSAKDAFYYFAFSFDIAKKIISDAPTLTLDTGAALTGSGPYTIADLNVDSTYTYTFGNNLTTGDIDVTVSPAAPKGITVDAATFGTLDLKPTANAETQTLTITAKLKGTAADNYEFAEGKDSIELTITKVSGAVALATGSQGTAGNQKITGLENNKKYVVTDGTNWYKVIATGAIEKVTDFDAAVAGSVNLSSVSETINGAGDDDKIKNGVTYDVYEVVEVTLTGEGADVADVARNTVLNITASSNGNKTKAFAVAKGLKLYLLTAAAHATAIDAAVVIDGTGQTISGTNTFKVSCQTTTTATIQAPTGKKYAIIDTTPGEIADLVIEQN